MSLSKPRAVALRVLCEIDTKDAYLGIALERALDAADMEKRDAALCSRITIGTIRNRGYIDNIIKNISSIRLRKLSPQILNVLRMGVYCIKFADKIPVSATVNECVKLARRYGGASSAGFVNAVLRKAAASGDFTDKLTGDELLCAKYSVPLWLVEKWRREQPDLEALLKAMNEEPPTLCRLNCETIPDGFEPTDISPYTVLYTGEGGVTRSEAYKSGLVTVQDGASQLAVLALKIERGQKVLDLCAAPGGKSTFAAYLGGEVTACDLYEHKIASINANAARLGVKLDARINDATVFNPEFEEKFDAVLVDAPCSGLGIIRRKPDIKWRRDVSDTVALAKIQREILNNAARYLKRGGRLVYSTCTLSRAENEDMTRAFVEGHPDFAPALLGVGSYPDRCEVCLRPDYNGTDGFFTAAFERKVL